MFFTFLYYKMLKLLYNRLMYFTIKLPNLSNCPKYTKPLLFILYHLYFNHLIRYYLNIKGDFSLPFKPINLANSKAIRLLLRPSILNTGSLIYT